MAARRRTSFQEQRQNVVQLSRDRKNAIGGYSVGLKDFAEMGPPSGEHWPLSAEQIKRAFGVPEERDNPDSDYVLTLRAESHVLLERTAERLRRHAPGPYSAWDRVFDPDSSGDRDYEWYKQRVDDARRRAAILKDDIRDLPLARRAREQERMVGEFKRWNEQASSMAELIERCDMFLDWLTLEMMDDELFVEFATRLTRLQEQKMEQENERIWDEYQDLKARKPKREARSLVCKKYGISDPTLYRIEQNRRQQMGLPPRSPGRPKKDSQ